MTYSNGKKRQNLYEPTFFRQTDDSKWPWVMLLYEVDPERMDPHLIPLQEIYHWEEKFGENICVTSLYFSPVQVYLKREHDALEIKMKYA